MIEPNKLSPFKKFCVTIGMIPSSYKTSLTYEEQLMWLCNYLENTVIPTVNNNAEALSEVQNLFTELQNYVDHYFDNLDVQEEINRKLDELVEDGTLQELVGRYFTELEEDIEELSEEVNGFESNLNLEKTERQNGDNTLNARIDQQNTTIQNFSTQFTNNLLQEKSERIEGDNTLEEQISNIVASAGTAGESSSEIIQARTNTKAMTFPSLNERINFIENTNSFAYNNAQNADFNQFVTPGKFLIYGTTSNAPYPWINQTGILIVEAMNPNSLTPSSYQWIVQRFYAFKSQYTKNGMASRIIQRTSTDPLTYNFGEWSIVNYDFLQHIYNNSNKIIRNSLAECFASNGLITVDTDLNTLLEEGSYLLTSQNNTNIPSTNSVLLVTNQCNDLGASSNNWIIQTARDINNDEIYQRVIMYNNTAPSSSLFKEWKKIYPVESGNTSLSDKKIVNFGDSIFGNYQGVTSVSQNIANITGATVFNIGFGGCQMSDRSDTGWKAFSMCNLATAVANQDFTMQDNAIADTSWVSKPSYFDSHLNTLKNIDFSEIDIVTISYGTNDYTAGDLLDNENNLKDINTFAGALRYTIETLLTAYPNLKIVIGTPIFRLWLNEGIVENTSDTRTFAGNYTLIDMTNKVKDIGKDYHCQVIDAYNNFGVNQYNWQRIFDSTDTTHPTANGRALLGRLYGVELLK